MLAEFFARSGVFMLAEYFARLGAFMLLCKIGCRYASSVGALR